MMEGAGPGHGEDEEGKADYTTAGGKRATVPFEVAGPGEDEATQPSGRDSRASGRTSRASGRSSRASGPPRSSFTENAHSVRESIRDSVRESVRGSIARLSSVNTSAAEAHDGLRSFCDDFRPTMEEVSPDAQPPRQSRHSALPFLEESTSSMGETFSGGTFDRVATTILSYGSMVKEELSPWLGVRLGSKRQFLTVVGFILVDSTRFMMAEGDYKGMDPSLTLIFFNLLSWSLSASVTLFVEGRRGWQKMLNRQRLLRCLLPAVLFSISQELVGFAFFRGITAQQNVTLGWMYLPIAMLQARYFFNRYYGRLEWLAVAMLTVSVLTFVLVLEQGKDGRPGIGVLDDRMSKTGAVLIVASATVSALASTLMERIMKTPEPDSEVEDEVYVHMFHLSSGMALTTIPIWLLMKLRPQQDEELGSPTPLWRHVLFLAVVISQAWFSALVAKNFSTVAKAVASAMSVVIVYFAFVRQPGSTRHILLGARYTLSLASVCLALIVVFSAVIFQTGRIVIRELLDWNRPANLPRAPPQHTWGLTIIHVETDESKSTSFASYGLLLLMVCAEAVRELVRQWALGGGAIIVFQSVTVLNSTCSIAFASFMALLSDGWSGVKLAWDVRGITKCLVVSVFFSLAATLGNMAYVFGVTATVSTIVGYFYMPLSAVASRWVLKRYYMWMEWVALLIVTLSSISYSTLETYATEQTQKPGEKKSAGTNFLPMAMVLGSVMLSVIGSLVSEKILKGERLPFCIQKVQLEVGSLLTAVGVLFLMPKITQRRLDDLTIPRPTDATCSTEHQQCMKFDPSVSADTQLCDHPFCDCQCRSGLLVGWNHRIILLLIVNILQGWIGGLVAKHTSTVHKGIAQCCSLLLIYAGSRMLMPESSGPSSTAMTMVTFIVPLSVMLFQCASHEMEQVWKVREMRLHNTHASEVSAS